MTSRFKFQAQSNANHKGDVLRLDPNDLLAFVIHMNVA
jgi:hypothetical protein